MCISFFLPPHPILCALFKRQIGYSYQTKSSIQISLSDHFARFSYNKNTSTNAAYFLNITMHNLTALNCLPPLALVVQSVAGSAVYHL